MASDVLTQSQLTRQEGWDCPLLYTTMSWVKEWYHSSLIAIPRGEVDIRRQP